LVRFFRQSLTVVSGIPVLLENSFCVIFSSSSFASPSVSDPVPINEV
jgi:hypothetical protein